MYDVVVVSFDSADSAAQALADLKEGSAGPGYAVIEAGLVKKLDPKGLILVDEFRGQGIDDQFMGLIYKVVAASGAEGASNPTICAVADAINAAPTAMVVSVYEPDEDPFGAFFGPYGGTVQRWDLREVQQAVKEARREEGDAYREAYREEKAERHEERKAERKASFEQFKKDINL